MHNRNLCEACLKAEYDSFVHECVHEYMAKNKTWLAKYEIDSWPRWDWSLEDATITFSKDSVAKVICEMQVVGITLNESWEWSWGNPHFAGPSVGRMDEVKQFGEENQWDKMTTLFLPSDDYIGWSCASVAAHLPDAIGVYRCPDGEGSSTYLAILSARFVAPPGTAIQ
jgi:hypothetical protein